MAGHTQCVPASPGAGGVVGGCAAAWSALGTCRRAEAGSALPRAHSGSPRASRSSHCAEGGNGAVAACETGTARLRRRARRGTRRRGGRREFEDVCSHAMSLQLGETLGRQHLRLAHSERLDGAAEQRPRCQEGEPARPSTIRERGPEGREVAPSMSALLDITHGPSAGTQFRVTPGAPISVGRGSDNGPGKIKDPSISRVHGEAVAGEAAGAAGPWCFACRPAPISRWRGRAEQCCCDRPRDRVRAPASLSPRSPAQERFPSWRARAFSSGTTPGTARGWCVQASRLQLRRFARTRTLKRRTWPRATASCWGIRQLLWPPSASRRRRRRRQQRHRPGELAPAQGRAALLELGGLPTWRLRLFCRTLFHSCSRPGRRRIGGRRLGLPLVRGSQMTCLPTCSRPWAALQSAKCETTYPPLLQRDASASGASHGAVQGEAKGMGGKRDRSSRFVAERVRLPRLFELIALPLVAALAGAFAFRVCVGVRQFVWRVPALAVLAT